MSKPMSVEMELSRDRIFDEYGIPEAFRLYFALRLQAMWDESTSAKVDNVLYEFGKQMEGFSDAAREHARQVLEEAATKKPAETDSDEEIELTDAEKRRFDRYCVQEIAITAGMLERMGEIASKYRWAAKSFLQQRLSAYSLVSHDLGADELQKYMEVKRGGSGSDE